MIAAILPAAGTGSRFAAVGEKLPKQYQSLSGQPVYAWAVSAFCLNAAIDKVVVVVSSDMLEHARAHLSDITLARANKITVITGGATRQESVRNGLEHLAADNTLPEYVLIHDAARPFITQAMIDDTIKCVKEKGACSVAIPLTDTIKKVTNGVIQETLDRSSLYLVQTPQAARFSWLLEAHRQAARSGIETTDDAAVLEQAGHHVSIVSGSRYNLKITNPEDLSISEALAPIVLKGRGS